MSAVHHPHTAEIEPVVDRYDRPVAFYAWATVIPWVTWLAAGWLSHRPDQTELVRLVTAALGLVGLAAPAGVAAWMLRGRPELWEDARRRLLWPRGRGGYVACAFLLLLASLLAGQAISLAFGYSAEQFHLRDGFTFSSGLLPVWFILVLAPVLEELGWHTYGTDALVSRMSLLSACLLTTVIWTFWHLPLGAIQGYYHSHVMASGWLQALNFPVSMVAFVIIMNWLYYRTGRSIGIAIVFHLTAGFVNEIFLTHPDSKLIQTALLLVVAAVVVARNRELFLGRMPAPDAPATVAVAQ